VKAKDTVQECEIIPDYYKI